MISVIIPILNEVDIIESSLSSLLNHRGDFEVIVSDGGSSDGTLNVVSRFPQVKQVISGSGRGRQMNEGAKLARGDIFLFLHADTYLPPSALQIIEAVMSESSVAGGSFCINFDQHNLLLRVYSFLSQINHILFTYGDQGLFLRCNTFRAIGGFKDIPIMEDVEIQVRLRSIGKFVKIREPVVTSARRFIKHGIIRQQILNTALVFLYHLGVSPSDLKRFYGDLLGRDR
jgi:rSAM/selenodomain-associated transferase 2